MKKIQHKHPGAILKEYFLGEMNITPYRLAKETKMSQMRISEIIRGKRSITVNTAVRLSKFFGNSFQFWMNLQNNFDKNILKNSELKIINQIHKYDEAVI